MYVKTKDLTLAAACLALSMLIILAESVLGFNTLFLLSLGGFLIGIVIRETGLKLGSIYFLASIFLSFILAPDKLKLIIFIGAELYLLLREAAWEFLAKDKSKDIKKVKRYYLIAKFLSFNVIFLPILLFLPELIMPNMDLNWRILTFLIAEFGWYFFDRAYDHFQTVIWDRMKYKK